jgi:hypothetical protein
MDLCDGRLFTVGAPKLVGISDVDGSLIGDGTIIARRLLQKWELNTGKEQGLGKMRT